MSRGAGSATDGPRLIGEIRRPVTLLFLVAALGLVLAPFGLGPYGLNIAAQAFILAVVAITVDLLWGYTGVLSYAQSAFFGIGAYAMGIAIAHFGVTAPRMLLAVMVGLALAAIVAFLIGSASFTPRASWLFIAVATFTIPVVFEQLVLSGGTFTGSSSGLSGFAVPPLTFPQWFLVSGAFLLVVAALAYRLVTSDAGRVLKAIRENEERCQYLGLDTSAIKTALFIACAIVASSAGIVYALFADVVAPNLGGFVLGTQLVIWVALGGRGTLVGPILATILINLATASLSGSLPFVWQLFIGALFVIVVMYLPGGLLPMVVRPWAAIGSRWPAFWPVAQRVHFTSPSRTGAAHPLELALFTGSQKEPASNGSSRTAAALELKGVSKNFGSLRVLDGIDLVVRRGELLSIIGPNGAGKTTLIRCISDGKARSSGDVKVNGHDIRRQPPQRLVGYGLCRKFQAPNVFDGLSVADCLRLATQSKRRPSVWSSAETLELPDAAMKVVSATGLERLFDHRAGELGHGQRQALELAMVLAVDPTVVLLDEPTAGLAHDERAAIGRVLSDLAATHNLCIILVEHDLDFVKEVSSRVVVLHQGKLVRDGTVKEVAESNLVREIYIGVGA